MMRFGKDEMILGRIQFAQEKLISLENIFVPNYSKVLTEVLDEYEQIYRECCCARFHLIDQLISSLLDNSIMIHFQNRLILKDLRAVKNTDLYPETDDRVYIVKTDNYTMYIDKRASSIHSNFNVMYNIDDY